MPHKNQSPMHPPNAPKEQNYQNRSLLLSQIKPELVGVQSSNAQQPVPHGNLNREMAQETNSECARRRSPTVTDHSGTTAHTVQNRNQVRTEKEPKRKNLCVLKWSKKEEGLLKRHKVPWQPQSPTSPPQAKGKSPPSCAPPGWVGDNLTLPPSSMTDGLTFSFFFFCLFLFLLLFLIKKLLNDS